MNSDIAEPPIMASQIFSVYIRKGDDGIFQSVVHQMVCGTDSGNCPAPVF